MEITLEWVGISGVIKLLLLFCVPLIIGYIIGRKTKRWKNHYQKKYVLFVKETLLGEKNGKEIGIMLNIVVKNVGL